MSSRLAVVLVGKYPIDGATTNPERGGDCAGRPLAMLLFKDGGEHQLDANPMASLLWYTYEPWSM